MYKMVCCTTPTSHPVSDLETANHYVFVFEFEFEPCSYVSHLKHPLVQIFIIKLFWMVGQVSKIDSILMLDTLQNVHAFYHGHITWSRKAKSG
jgi:hypothetical protein